ncbi:MAG: cation diffusion facilitator family transporter [Candidatus Methylomirabilia bacterium]
MFGRETAKNASPHDPQHHHHPPGHWHGVVDPSIITTQRGIWAVKWSLLGLLATASIQAGIVVLSGSVALLADTIHNFVDAATAIPLWIAFRVSRLKPSRRFTYGYGRVEDLAGLAIVLSISLSAITAGYQSVDRLLSPRELSYLWAVIGASLIGFFGNEAVAVFRIHVGKEIGSAALVTDGYHARADGLTSLAVLFGAVGVWLGYPLADPLAGLLITLVIFRIVWQSGRSVFTRLLDGVDPEVVEEIKQAASTTRGVRDASEVRVRWVGHRLHAELNVAVDSGHSVEEGHAVAKEVRHQLLHQLRFLSRATIHVDPVGASGEDHHRIVQHVHDDFSAHSH